MMILNWLRRFMYGRYGADQFGVFLLVMYCVLLLIARLFGWPILSILTLLLAVYALFRMLSKNVGRRAKENRTFLRIFAPFKKGFQKIRYRLKDRKFHRYFKCPACKKQSRVPKGRGKIEITCPHCGHKFIKKT